MTNISLKELIAEGLSQDVDCALYGDSCCVLRNVLGKDIQSFREPFESAVRMDVLTVMLVEGGSLTLKHDLLHETVGRGGLFVIRPGSVVELEQVTADFRCWLVLLDAKIVDRLNVSLQKVIPYLGQRGGKPVHLLTEKQQAYADQLLRLLFLCISYNGSSTYYHEAVQCHITGLVYFLLGILAQKVQEAEQAAGVVVRSRDEEYFQRFMRLLQQHFRRERKTTFYAREMCLSPKYLSTIVRRFSGRGPSEWIDECVLVEAKRLLKFTDRSVQEIAFELNFPTQSFFGRYFKSHTGLSPKAFKQQ